MYFDVLHSITKLLDDPHVGEGGGWYHEQCVRTVVIVNGETIVMNDTFGIGHVLGWKPMALGLRVLCA